MENNKIIKSRKEIDASLICIALFSIFFLCLGGALYYNPNPDAYWLVSTGRWIMKNKAMPTQNPWVFIKDIDVVVQQPLVAIANYLFGEVIFKNIHSLWILAILFNIVEMIALVFAVFAFVKKREGIEYKICLSLLCGEIFLALSGLVNTRPYLLTIAFFCATFAIIKNYENKKTGIIKSALEAMIIGMMVVYTSSASIVSPLIVGFAFFISSIIKRRYIQTGGALIMGTSFFVGSCAASLTLGQGFKNVFYLFMSSPTMAKVGSIISEMAPAKLFSASFVILMLGYAFAIFWLKKDVFYSVLLVLASTMSLIAQRNTWMVIILLSIGAASLHPRKIRISTLSLIGLMSGIVLISTWKNGKSPYDTYYKGLENYKDVLEQNQPIFTDFNSGAFVEYIGLPITIDARPELYGKEIGKTDLIYQWYSANYKTEVNSASFVNSLNCLSAIVEKKSKIDNDLKNDGWKIIGGNDRFDILIK